MSARRLRERGTAASPATRAGLDGTLVDSPGPAQVTAGDSR